ncbi:MAG TPA: cupin domain-containing protein [Thermoplasmata archaeon]|jgi:mannose-6-phosphate isomerase-like protein (cupin superfamily)|nr:cupin domain-containing protein [Thermoplasmata archaeon]
MTAIEEEAERAKQNPGDWREFLRVPTMSVGVYVLAPGAIDRQSPHSEDEIYYVVRGRGRLTHGSVDSEAKPGEVLFVPAHVPHRFHSITEELVLLVVFAPPERVTG